MKTVRNGILETSWRKFKAFVNTPLFDFLCSVLLFLCIFLCIGSGMEVFPSVESIPWFIVAGVSFSGFLGYFLSFLHFLLTYKPSAEADKNKNENKE